MDTPVRRIDPVRQHRRAVLYRIALPVVLTGVLLVTFAIVLIAGTASGSLESKQISIIMGVLLTAFVMIPTVLLCLVPYTLLVFIACGAGWTYSKGKQPLRAVRQYTAQITRKTDEFAPRVSAPFAAFNVRATRWEHRLRALRSPDPSQPGSRHTSEEK